VQPSTFVQLFPEFAETNAILVAGKLTLAATRMGGPDATVWGPFAQPGQAPTTADLAQANLAAHLLMTSPMGTSTLLAANTGGKVSTAYFEEFERLELAMCSGAVVAGGATPGTLGPPNPGINFQVQFSTVALVNGSNAVNFSTSQIIPAGTVLVFAAQPGAYYTVANNVNGTTGQLMSAYTGVSNTASGWSAS
jgi:hypothetical protein